MYPRFWHLIVTHLLDFTGLNRDFSHLGNSAIGFRRQAQLIFPVARESSQLKLAFGICTTLPPKRFIDKPSSRLVLTRLIQNDRGPS